MTIISSTDLRFIGAQIISPFLTERVVHMPSGMSYGLSSCGYDVRLKQDIVIWPKQCVLASTIEMFRIPLNMRMTMHDKSTQIRKFLSVSHDTVAEPGWYGYLTLELINHSWRRIHLFAGQPIAQVAFDMLTSPTDRPYTGKYQGQGDGPVEAIKEVPLNTQLTLPV